MPTVRMPSSLHARKMRIAISPRFAHSTLWRGTMAIRAMVHLLRRACSEGYLEHLRLVNALWLEPAPVAAFAASWRARLEQAAPRMLAPAGEGVATRRRRQPRAMSSPTRHASLAASRVAPNL